MTSSRRSQFDPDAATDIAAQPASRSDVLPASDSQSAARIDPAATTDVVLDLDHAAESWDRLAAKLDAFIQAWETAEQPPPLIDSLAEEIGPFRRFALIELVKIDLEYRAKRDVERFRLEEYAQRFPELLEDGGMAVDLIFEEYHVRRNRGEDVRPEEYIDRFPYREAEIERLFAIDAPAATTSLGKAVQLDLSEGDRLDDFQLIVLLGKGAFGSVYLARQESMQRFVALKVTADLGDEPQTLAQLDHPNIVRVYDQSQVEDRRLRLMYMQFLPGGTLGEVLDRARKQPPAQRSGLTVLNAISAALGKSGQLVEVDLAAHHKLADASWAETICSLGAQLADALDYAHLKGVLHRDIKPANVLLAVDGTPKLADFNISFCSEVEGASAGAFFGGSIAYMSPEQLEAFDPRHQRGPDELDGRSDLYSLAVLLWELYCGRRPYPDEAVHAGWATTLDGMLARRTEGSVEESQFVCSDDVARRLREVLLRCLSCQREDRFSSGAELARELRLCRQPRAARLLDAPTASWRVLVLRYPILSLLMATLLPNALAAIFNFAYNNQEIIDRLADSRDTFMNVVFVINAIAFPGGLAVLFVLVLPIARRLRMPAAEKLSFRQEERIRLRALRLGNQFAWTGIIAWCVAAPTYPICLHLLLGGLAAWEYVHFVASLVLCGLIVAAYPFFLVSFFSLQVLYPALVRRSESVELDHAELERLSRRSGVYLIVAGGVPALGVTGLVLAGFFTQLHSNLALLVLSIISSLGLALAFWLYRIIQRDIRALEAAHDSVGFARN